MIYTRGMDKDAIIARRDQAENNFNSFLKQKEEKENEIKQIDLEMSRLQGEYRLCAELIEKLESPDTPKKVSKSANKIDVKNAIKDDMKKGV